MTGRDGDTRTRRRQGASIRDVARLAGVSPGTASRVLSGSSYPVSERSRRRVEEAARALNYVTNSVARALVTGRSEVVGAIVHDISDPFFSGVVRGLQDAAAAAGRVVMAGNDDRDAGKLESYLTMLLSQKPTGVVLIGGQLRDPASTLPVAQAVERLKDQGVPVVAVGRYELDIPHVAVDDAAAAECAAAHLLALGHRRIAFLGGPLNSTTVQDRYSGYARALVKDGVPLDDDLVIQTPLTLEGGSEGAASLLSSGVGFTAVFAATDEVAFGAIATLREHGRRTPGDVSVVGFNDVAMSAHSDPPLTTIHVPIRELGLAAWRLLTADEGPRPDDFLPFELVVRASTAPPSPSGTISEASGGDAPPSHAAAGTPDTVQRDRE